jgi:hypothetical protein
MDYLARVIDALRQQTLPREQWELLVVDNASAELVDGRLDLGWHGNARIVSEERLGLTFARLRGFAEAKGGLIVMVDDDNVLAPDYLETAVRIAEEHPMLGAFGGKCLPEFEHEPPEWLAARGKGLGLRDRGDREELFPEAAVCGQLDNGTTGQSDTAAGRVTTKDGGLTASNRQRRAVREFPDCAPIGAGMVLRRDAAAAYAERIEQRTTGPRDNGTAERMLRSSELRVAGGGSADSPKHRSTETPPHRAASVITDRRGDSLASGGDNDICLTALEHGWQVGYLPQLQLTHLIPKERMTLDYHKRMVRDSIKSFILMLDQHGIRPWPAMPKWTLPLRVASDWLRVKPWRGPEQSLRFWGHVGMYEGRACLLAGL